MIYHDYYLKFADEAAFLTATEALEGCEYSVLGTVYNETGVTMTNEEGLQYPELTPVEGHHVNARCVSEQPSLALFDTQPTTPRRVWG